MDDIRALDDTRKEEESFQTVDAVSQLNDRLYKTFVSPWVQAMTTPQSAELLRRLHPLRLQHTCFSCRNPAMAPLPPVAEWVRQTRRLVAADNPFLAMEKMTSAAIVAAWDTFRDVRDTWSEGVFQLAYGPTGLGAIFPPKPWIRHGATMRELPAPITPDAYTAGGPLAAVLRIVAGAVINRGVFDRRSALVLRELRQQSQFKDVKNQVVRELFKQQAKLLRQDPDRAINALAVMLPTMQERRIAVEAARQILLLAPEDIQLDQPMTRRLAEVLEMDLSDLTAAVNGAHV
jgi:hypothetical protein